jgi:hypothetical protein
MNYATLYWKEDIRGIVLLAPSQEGYGPDAPIWARIGGETNTYNLTTKLANMASIMNYSSATPNAQYMNWFKYAFDNPGGAAIDPISGSPLPLTINPATSKPWTNITEYMTWFVLSFLRTVYNVREGYGNITNIIYQFANFEGGPNRLVLEDQAMIDWTNCPYMTRDFDDHYSEIGVPLLAFADEMQANSTGKFRFLNGINNADFTGIMLQKYGHGDVHCGVYAARDVFQPALDWMRSELVGLKATAFCNVTVLPGWTWWFFAHSIGGIGACTYQWYEGTTMLQGQTTMVLPVTKNTPGTYTFQCKVTDAEGTTTNSNTVTLTVR